MHCLSFDIEEHFQVSAFESPMRRRHWDQFESRVEQNTHRILDLLDRRKLRATFFVLGWVAERHPDLVRSILTGGHEIASHGYAHELITAQTPDQFREDVRKGKCILEDLTNTPVLGYRAPGTFLSSEASWVFQVLIEEGYAYDSSVSGAHYCIEAAAKGLSHGYKIQTDQGFLWEVPPLVLRTFGVPLPLQENSQLRFYPATVLHRTLSKFANKQQSCVLALNVWEFDPEQPRMAGSARARFEHYYHLSVAEQRLIDLLNRFAFLPIQACLPENLRPPQRRSGPILVVDQPVNL
jgi:polysaccharide deacetylase family protein (PEP-CTERM system associated)